MVVAGRNVEPAMADACVASGVDLVAMTRAIIADPDLPEKARVGRAARPCIGLNEGCIGRLYTDRPMWCSVNPSVRDPELAELAPAARRDGSSSWEVEWPGWRRHAVPRSRSLSRALRAPLAGRRAGSPRRGPTRTRALARYIDWLQDEAEAAGAELRTGVAATAQEVLADRRMP